MALFLSSSVLAETDSDGDLLPDAWEVAHFMNPNDDSDAMVDFDRDGLTAVQEYELELSGEGQGPCGKWTATVESLTSLNQPGMAVNTKKIVDVNDRGDILVNVVSYNLTVPRVYQYAAWIRSGTNGTWRKLTTVDGVAASYLSATAINDDGTVVGAARLSGVNGGLSFGFVAPENTSSTDVAPWDGDGALVAPVAGITDINDWGDLIGRTGDGNPFLYDSITGFVEYPSTWSEPVFNALNNHGEVVGVEWSDYWGLPVPCHFLMMQGWTWHSEFPAYDKEMFDFDPEYPDMDLDTLIAEYNPSLINDWGEFAGNFYIELEEGEPMAEGSWFFDGTYSSEIINGYYVDHYRELLPLPHERQTIRGLNNWPQLLVTSADQDGESIQAFLHVGGLNVPFSSLTDHPDVLNIAYGASLPEAINNRSLIVGFTDSGNGLYLLKLDQDQDGDGMPDDWEQFYGLLPNNSSDAQDDPDEDGISNLAEFILGSAPTSVGNRLAIDIDGDGLPDAWERKYLGGLLENGEGDHDGDGLTNREEWVIQSNPASSDSDGDGLSDKQEWEYGTDLLNVDSDSDGIPDLYEIGGSDPLDGDDVPAQPPYVVLETTIPNPSEGGLWPYTSAGYYPWLTVTPSEIFPPDMDWFAPTLKIESLADNTSEALNGREVHSRLRADYPGSKDYRLNLLKVTEIGDEVTGIEAAEFMIGAQGKYSNSIETKVEGYVDVDGTYDPDDIQRQYLLPVDLDIIHPVTGELDEGKQSDPTEGGYVAVRRDDETPVTKLVIREGASVEGMKYRIKFDAGANFKIWKDEARTQSVTSEQTEFEPDQETTLYLEGLKKSDSIGQHEITLQAVIGGESHDAETIYSTVVEAEFDVWLNVFIPVQWTDFPAAHPIHNDFLMINPVTGVPIYEYRRKIAAGDDRSFNDEFFDDPARDVDDIPGGTSSRVHAQVTIIPFKDLDDDGIKNNSYKDAIGISHNYLKDGSVPDPGAGYSATNRLLPQPIITQVDRESPDKLKNPSDSIERYGIDQNAVRFRFEGSADNPIVNPSPAIDWDFQIAITVNNANVLAPKWLLLGDWQDGFPGYEIYIRDSDGDQGDNKGTPIYQYDPIPLGRTPVDLFPDSVPGSIDETVTPANGEVP